MLLQAAEIKQLNKGIYTAFAYKGNFLLYA